MKALRTSGYPCGNVAFTLVEMAVVIVILVIVMTAGIGWRNAAPAVSRRTAVDLVTTMGDHARTTAIARRTSVVMALAAPADLSAGEDGQCRIGLFQVISEDGTSPTVVRTVSAVGRWRLLDRGYFWKPGKVEGALNPWDAPRLVLRTKRGTLHLHGILFDARGGVAAPIGSAPVVIQIADSSSRAADGAVSDTRLHVGRVTGRIYQHD